jgi:two-component system, sensor histidine kinase RegB
MPRTSDSQSSSPFLEDAHLAMPGVRVQTLISIRWIAIAGQLATLMFVAWGLNFPIVLAPALAAVSSSVLLNLALGFVYTPTVFLNGRQAGLQLAFDILQLAVLLYLTGGLMNPFALLIVVPVTISANLLSLRSTLGLLAIAGAALSALSLWSLPLPWLDGTAPALPQTYRFGVWVALMTGMGFLAAYSWRVSAEARRRQRALIATQQALARAQQLSAVGGLAAAAAHELGSPLGTILLIAKDLERELHNDPDFGDDVRMLREQAAQCGDILKSISLNPARDAHFQRATLAAIVGEVVAAHFAERVVLDVTAANNLHMARSPELLHALENIIANAVRHARITVVAEVKVLRESVQLEIRDDGLGFPVDLIARLGEPYLASSGFKTSGMGLGIFIALSLLERIGAKVQFNNLSAKMPPAGVSEITGAQVIISWPKSFFTSESNMS